MDSKDLDHHAHPSSLTRIFAICIQQYSMVYIRQPRPWLQFTDAQAKLGLRWQFLIWSGLYNVDDILPIKKDLAFQMR